jgi:hypothetical protein
MNPYSAVLLKSWNEGSRGSERGAIRFDANTGAVAWSFLALERAREREFMTPIDDGVF